MIYEWESRTSCALARSPFGFRAWKARSSRELATFEARRRQVRTYRASIARQFCARARARAQPCSINAFGNGPVCTCLLDRASPLFPRRGTNHCPTDPHFYRGARLLRNRHEIGFDDEISIARGNP